MSCVGIKERKYKVWKQITTESDGMFTSCRLVSKNVNTKFESKSQHGSENAKGGYGWYQRT